MPISLTRVRKTSTPSSSVISSVISLVKGQKSDLTKNNPDLTKIRVALGWDVNQYDGGCSFDLDASAFLVSANGKVTNDADFIFYNNKEHPSGAVTHSGDNQEGGGDGEIITVDLKKLPESINSVAFTVTIHEAEERGQNFGQVSNAYITIYDDDTNKELIRYDLGGDFSIETAVVVGEIYRRSGEWKFNAIGSGFKGGLLALCLNYGLEVEGN